MERLLLDWIDLAEKASESRPRDLAAWTEQQTREQTYIQRLVSLVRRLDLETRPPPREIRSFLFRGSAHELVSWPAGWHPDSCVWFPNREVWLLLRRAPLMPFVALVAGRSELEAYGLNDLAQIVSHKYESGA